MIIDGNTYYKVMNGITRCNIRAVPYDAEIEYLESSGTQYIDTGITCTTPTKYILRGSKVGNRTSNRSGFFGSNAWIYSLIFYASDNNLRWCNYSSRYDFNNLVSGTFYDIECNKNGLMYVDGNETILNSDTNFGGDNIKIFVGAYYAASSVRISKFKIYNGETLLLDLIPVRKGNIGYMYDKVSGKLFGNSGTGNFILGPDKEERPYISGHVTDGSSTFTFKVNINQSITVPVDSNGNWKWFVDRTITSLRQAFFGYTTFELNYINFVNINVSSITDIYQIIGTNGTWSNNDPLCVLNMSKCKGILKIQTFNYVIYRSHTNWILPNVEGNIQNNSSASTVEAGGTINGNIFINGCSLMDKNKVLSIIKAAINNNTYTLHSAVYNKCKSGGEWYTDIQAAIDAKAQQGYTVTLISA